ncbi:sigma-70 family RNA polymerase sigma factor [Curtobacterium flaccumfaciens pv. flaccumfaciens]|nr:sigma-70 family RNA polymerase sigma factor [Curtobacterium flaccumfaciens pv. flaccumfaciens]
MDSSAPTGQYSDAELIDATRAGDRAAYGLLWARHADAGRRVARSITQTFDADDLVSEAYTKILAAVAAGKGPTGPFRPYLFVTIRNIAASWARSRRETTVEDADEVADPRATDATALAALDSSLTLRAFRMLPERWQEVLWFTEVDALAPAEVAKRLGMSANGVAALAYRAREGLRQAWIQAHIDTSAADPAHKWTLEHVGKNARGALSPRAKRRFDQHLEQCPACTVLADEAVDTSSRFTPALLPLAVGTLGATGLGAFLSSGEPARADAAEADPSGLPHTPRRGHSRLYAGFAAVLAVVLIITGVGFALNQRHSDGKPRSMLAASVGPSPPPESKRPAPRPTSATGEPAATAPPTARPTMRSTPVPAPPTEPEETASAPPGGPESSAAERVPAQGTPSTLNPRLNSIDTAGGILLPIVTGTARPGSSVMVTVGDVVTSVQADAVGKWSTPPVPVRAGTHPVFADADGERTETRRVTITAPTLFLSTTSEAVMVTVRGEPRTQYEIRADGTRRGAVTTDSAGKASATVDGADVRTVDVVATADRRVGPATEIRTK